MRIYYFTCPTSDRHVAHDYWAKLRDGLEGIAYIANPFYYQNGDPKPEIRALDGGGKPSITKEDIVEMDLELIHMAESGVIAYLSDKTSHGSAMELWEVHKHLKRPLYTLGKTTPEDREEHPWIDYCITETFENVYALIKMIKELDEG